ncbi:putative orf [Candidatus Kuenenia stuttgartiensis]|uniref:Putative orf n=2 Tax=Kuenenia stuttgartiensis TaxID=174633 RepID=A0A2C9CDE8_KUEST|nr:putative orf [Candidatus Kuenenia stuttgartiensis]
MDKLYSVYIMANKINTVLYTWVPNNLKRRVYGHREKRVEVSYDGYYEVASEKTLAMTSGCFRKDKRMPLQRQADVLAMTI